MNITNWKIGNRLILGFGLILGLMIVISLVAAVSMSRIAELPARMYAGPFMANTAVQRIGTTVAAMEKALKDVELANDAEEIDVVQSRLAKLEAEGFKDFDIVRADFPEQAALVDATRKAFAEWKPIRDQIISLMRQDEWTQALEIKNTTGTAKLAKLNGQLGELIAAAVGQARMFMADAEDSRDRAMFITVALLALALAGGLALGIMVTRSITSPFLCIVKFAEEVASGDMEASIPESYGAEFGKVQHAIEAMVDNLKQKILEATEKERDSEIQARKAEQARHDAEKKSAEVGQLLETINKTALRASDISTKVADAATGLSAKVSDANRGAEMQRGRMAETSTGMEEMNASVMSVANNATQASEGAASAWSKAREGGRTVASAVEAIDRVNTMSNELKVSLEEMGVKTDSIDEIVGVINEIADQTNLLALNAAIEAARAGEAGKGFSVVADEVRKLAEKTMISTNEVGKAIQDIQEEARLNLQSMDNAVEAVNEATALAGESGQALTEIVELVESLKQQVEAIAISAREQSATSEHITHAVEEVNEIASQTTAGMGEANQSISGLAELARQLNMLIDEMQYK